MTILHPHSTLLQYLWKPVECTSAQTLPTLVPLQTARNNYSRNVWRFWVEGFAEKWPIILKNCSMLGDTYNAQKNASIIYLGLAENQRTGRSRRKQRNRDNVYRKTESRLYSLITPFPKVQRNVTGDVAWVTLAHAVAEEVKGYFISPHNGFIKNGLESLRMRKLLCNTFTDLAVVWRAQHLVSWKPGYGKGSLEFSCYADLPLFIYIFWIVSWKFCKWHFLYNPNEPSTRHTNVYVEYAGLSRKCPCLLCHWLGQRWCLWMCLCPHRLTPRWT